VTPVLGFTQMRGDRPRLPGSPKYGQPSVHVTGVSVVNRPTELASIIERPHHSPSGVSTMPPWWMALRPGASGLPGRIVNGGPERPGAASRR
jgi:hypothetical protein